MIFNSDSYNGCHFRLYEPGTVETSCYLEARASSKFDNLSIFGIQYFIKKYLMEEDLSKMDIDRAERMWTNHGEPFNREGWEKIKELGYYPIEIQAVPEGTWLPKDNVILQMRSTDPDFYWLPTWMETQFVELWYPIGVATRSKYAKIMLYRYLKDTGCTDISAVLPFMLHDFGFRACACREMAKIGGAAHLTNFMGTDTFTALPMIEDYYHSQNVGFSIPATNHAVITSWKNEMDAFRKVLAEFLVAGKIVACVSDSYDYYNALNLWCTEFKEQIENSGGRLVLRPDSGNPVHLVTMTVRKLSEHFGYTVNEKGYKVLPHCVRVIWGDGINPAKVDEVLYYLQANGFAAENVIFGMGSALLNEIKRDDVGVALKLNERVTNGERIPVRKNPVTGKGKASKAGRQALIKCDGYYFTVPEEQLGCRQNLLRTVYKDGVLLIDEDFETIRTRTNEEGFGDYELI